MKGVWGLLPPWSYFEGVRLSGGFGQFWVSFLSVIGICRTGYPFLTNTVNRIDETGFSTSSRSTQKDSKMLDIATLKTEWLQPLQLILFPSVLKKWKHKFETISKPCIDKPMPSAINHFNIQFEYIMWSLGWYDDWSEYRAGTGGEIRGRYVFHLSVCHWCVLKSVSWKLNTQDT